MGSRVRIRLFHILHFVMHILFPVLKILSLALMIGVTGYEFARRVDVNVDDMGTGTRTPYSSDYLLVKRES